MRRLWLIPIVFVVLLVPVVVLAGGGEGGFDGVVGGLGFASFGFGTGRKLAVGAVGVDLGLGGHG